MLNEKRFLAFNSGICVACLALAFGLSALTGCSAGDEARGSSKSGAPELIGGEQAGTDQFRATVGINDSCSAAKVGPRLFLTAAHCVALDRPMHGRNPPANFPPNAGVRDEYLPGQPPVIDWGVEVNDTTGGT